MIVATHGRVVVLVTGVPGAGKTTVARVTWHMLLNCPSGAVVDVWIDPKRDDSIDGSLRAVIDTSRVFEVLCDIPGELAAARYAARRRHPGHLPPDDATLSRIVASAPLMKPLGLGPCLRLDTSGPVAVDDVITWLGAHS